MINTLAVETYIAGCATRAGVSVKWEDRAVPRTDGRVMTLPTLSTAHTRDDVMRLQWMVKHETSHIRFTDFDALNTWRPKGLLMFIYNLLEDHRIDHLNDMEYYGDKRLSEVFYELWLENFLSRAADADMLHAHVLFAWDMDWREMLGASRLSDSIRKHCRAIPGFSDAVDILDAGDYGTRLRDLRVTDNTVEMQKLAEDILRDVFKQNPEEQRDNAPGEGGGGKGEGKGDEQGEDKEGDTGEKGSPTKGEGMLEIKEMSKSTPHEYVISNVGIKFTGSFKYGDFHPAPLSTFKVKRSDGKQGGNSLDVGKCKQTAETHSKGLGNKLRLKLMTQARDRYTFNHKKGKVHGASLHRLFSDNREVASKIFKRREVNTTLDTAVFLLVDSSGSMSGAKYQAACASALTMVEALRPLHIPVAVVGFTTDCYSDEDEPPVMWVHKDWGENVPSNTLAQRFTDPMLLNNTDGEALTWAYNHISQRKESRKILIVFSDGAPAGGECRGDPSSHTKLVCEQIQKEGKVDLYGIGILDTNVKNFYAKHNVIKNIGELPAVLLNTIEKAI